MGVTRSYTSASINWLPFGLLLKIGNAHIGAESETVQYIRKNTIIAVPQINSSATGYVWHYMLMKCIDGVSLQCVWQELDTKQRSRIVSQLRSFIAQLRTLKPPPVVSRWEQLSGCPSR